MERPPVAAVGAGDLAARLRAERRGFVTATVVRAERPTSAHPGDRALVLDDGTVQGFVGGECAQASVQAEALAALGTGEPVLLRIVPESDAPPPPEAGVVTVHNLCLSGGSLEIFLEPSVPPALVVVHGEAPIAQAVQELADWLGLAVGPGSGAVPPDAAAVVIATHGGDEAATLLAALRAGVGYIGLVASPRRGAAVLDGLDLTAGERARIHTPAGFDIGARSPREIALSVLAEIVSVRPRPERRPSPPVALPDDAPVATDPVCGMTVAAVDATRHRDHDGVRYWFCGPGCETAFLGS